MVREAAEIAVAVMAGKEAGGISPTDLFPLL